MAASFFRIFFFFPGMALRHHGSPLLFFGGSQFKHSCFSLFPPPVVFSSEFFLCVSPQYLSPSSLFPFDYIPVIDDLTLGHRYLFFSPWPERRLVRVYSSFPDAFPFLGFFFKKRK